VAARRVARAVREPEDGVRGERDAEGLDRSLWSKPRAYQPTAALLLTMNIAARSTCFATSATRWVSTSERFAPFSIGAIEALSPE
jgi:hypothetical protein